MPEQEIFGRCDTGDCSVIIRSVLIYEGDDPCDIRVFPDSPIIGECQTHHLTTDLTAQHNAFVLFTSETEAEEGPIDDETSRYDAYTHKFPRAFGRLSVTRQGEYTSHFRRRP